MPPKRIKRRSISRLQSSSGGTKGRWWDLITKKSAKKWKTLSHNGPLFPPSYDPLPTSVKVFHKGSELKLDKTDTKNPFHVTPEEALLFYTKALETNDRTLSRWQ